MSDDGYLSILGRSKELIISGGYNVYPAEVEAVLLAHPEVHRRSGHRHPVGGVGRGGHGVGGYRALAGRRQTI